MAEWSEVVATTLSQYTKGAVDLTIRENPILKTLQDKGQFFYDQSGQEMTWQVKMGEPDAEAYTGGSITFEPTDKHRRLNVPWRGYKISDRMDEKETLMNRGAEALIKRYSEVFPDMRDKMRRTIELELYNDGATNDERWHGLETFLSDDGATVAADVLARPDSTYGSLSCTPGVPVSGSWSADLATKPNATIATDWPEGQGDPEYGFHSPVLGNWSSTGWGTGSTSWIDNCERVLRRTSMWLSQGAGRDRKLDVHLMTMAMYYDYLNRASTIRKLDVPAKRLVELGFEGVMQDGVEVTYTYGVPANTVYHLNYDKIEVRCMYDQLFITKGPEWQMENLSWIFLLICYGNFKFISPSFFGKSKNYA